MSMVSERSEVDRRRLESAGFTPEQIEGIVDICWTRETLAPLAIRDGMLRREDLAYFQAAMKPLSSGVESLGADLQAIKLDLTLAQGDMKWLQDAIKRVEAESAKRDARIENLAALVGDLKNGGFGRIHQEAGASISEIRVAFAKLNDRFRICECRLVKWMVGMLVAVLTVGSGILVFALNYLRELLEK